MSFLYPCRLLKLGLSICVDCMIFSTNASENMVLDSTGSLGIGTSAPGGGYNLHIYTSSGNAYGYIQTAGTL